MVEEEDIIYVEVIHVRKKPGRPSGFHQTEETKEKIRKSHLGVYPSAEAREKMRQAKLGKPSNHKGHFKKDRGA